MKEVNERGLVLVGCGFMGKALLEGWMAKGVRPDAVWVQDPAPSDWLTSQAAIHVNQTPPENPAVLVIATKPQILDQALPGLAPFGGGSTVVISIAAGAPISLFEATFGAETPIVRVMPNLPASIGVGASALFASGATNPDQTALVRTMFEAVGSVVELEEEHLLHAVTGLSGSGPAYVFALAEAMAQAGVEAGLPPELAKILAAQTVSGAGEMLRAPDADAAALRVAVTSKGGTTAAGLVEFMAEDGIGPLTRKTVDAAKRRSIELSES